MKVLFVSADAGIYGASTAMLQLIKNLNGKDIEFEVLLSRHGEIENKLTLMKIRYHIIKFTPWLVGKKESRIKNIFRKIYNKLVIPLLFMRFKDSNIDIIHTNSSVTNIGYELSKKLKCKHVWHIREDSDFYNFDYIYKLKYVRRCYENSSAIITISNYIKQCLIEKIGKINNVEVIYDGIEIPVQKEIAYTKNTNICIVGSLSKNKNQLYVCKVLSSIILLNKYDIQLYIVGGASDKKYYQEVKNYIVENKMENYVHLIGHCTNVSKYYSMCDVGIMASVGEGFGLVTAEYMANSLFVLGNNSGATPELIENYNTGVLFDISVANDLYNKLILYLENKKLYFNMRMNAYNSLKNNFNDKNTSSLVKCLYMRLMKND